MTNRNHHLDNFHDDYGKHSDYPEGQTLEYAKVEMLCTIADILEEILEELKKKWMSAILRNKLCKRPVARRLYYSFIPTSKSKTKSPL